MELRNLEHKIIAVEKNSIAKEIGIEPGNVLLSINDKKIKDIFDYRYLIQDELVNLCVRDNSGEECLFEIEKDEYEDLGLVFENGLMDCETSCKNKCIFCFIDQLPKNMRKTLYFKDDDSRLSFLSGNYVTLTNMSDEDIDRIIFYHLSPINISVHTTDPKLRQFMLKNPAAQNIIQQLNKLNAANIRLNFQIVLCKNINDGQHLDKTIEDLAEFIPNAQSLSVVPAGLSKYRDNLFHIENFNEEDAKKIVAQIEKWQQKIYSKAHTKFVFAADEFYIKAKLPIPNYDEYEDFPQLENGVGMLALFQNEFESALAMVDKSKIKAKKVSIVTSMAAYDFILQKANVINNLFKQVEVKVYGCPNDFFGENITVSGLLTGGDVIDIMKGKDIGDYLLLAENMFRSGTQIMLDDTNVDDLQNALNTKVIIVKNNGQDFLNKILY